MSTAIQITMQSAAVALVDSRTRRIVPGESLCGEPPHLRQAYQLDEAAFVLNKISLECPRTRKQSGTAVFQFIGQAYVRQTHLSQEKGEGV